MSNIVSANYTEGGSVNVVLANMPPDTWISVPPDPGNKDYIELQAWVAEGNTIDPYVPPPPPPPSLTLQDLMVRVDDLTARVEALERGILPAKGKKT